MEQAISGDGIGYWLWLCLDFLGQEVGNVENKSEKERKNLPLRCRGFFRNAVSGPCTEFCLSRQFIKVQNMSEKNENFCLRDNEIILGPLWGYRVCCILLVFKPSCGVVVQSRHNFLGDDVKDKKQYRTLNVG